jgi:uncharacterized protein (TIGR03435 family)
MTMTKIAAGMLLASWALLLGQSAPAQTFEVASVKPSDPNARGGSISFPNGTFTAIGITARNCITLAYDIPSYQLAGGPGWIGDQHYDIVAKMSAGAVKAPRDPERMPQMRAALQALLADRFQLVIRRETRMIPGYALVVAKNGFKLKKTADEGQADFSSNRGKLTAHQISMELLARNLSGNLSSPVVDMTGIKGVFDLTLARVDTGRGAVSGEGGRRGYGTCSGPLDFHRAARAAWLETGDPKDTNRNASHRQNRKASRELAQ